MPDRNIPVTADDADASVSPATAAAGEALQAELVKWRSRVPRLASALRRHAEEAAALRLELMRLRGELPAEQPDDAASAADSTAAETAETAAELATLRAERDELRRRNAELLETTSVAQRQITSLSESVSMLRNRLKARECSAAETIAELTGDLQVLLASARGVAGPLGASAETVADEALAEALAELREELGRSVDRNERLEQQLAERAALVVALEQEQAQQSRELAALRDQHADVEAALLRAERQAEEHAGHIRERDDRIERQQTLMLALEQELAEARSEHAAAEHRHRAELEALLQEKDAARQESRKLERAVRDRTRALNQLQWRREVAAGRSRSGQESETGPGLLAEGAASTSAHPAASEAASPAGPGRGARDRKLLLVLNQQLGAANARNAALAGRVRELEAELQEAWGDDLTRIRGIGRRLAEQLRAAGIRQLQQIATLAPEALEDPDHVLHAHRGRIQRDGWIQQAARLIGD